MSHEHTSEKIVLRSSIRTDLLRMMLLKGTILGAIGVICLLMGGVFIPLQQMKEWGFLLFIFSLTMIIIGLVPYTRLRRLEEKPYTLTIEGLESIHFSRGKLLFTVPIHSIDHISYLDQGKTYGICIFLKRPFSEKKLVAADNRFDLFQFWKNSLSHQQCDLFFPYFSQRSFHAFQDCLS